MESAIFHACKQANIVSLHAIETGVSALRQRFDANPESVSDDDVYGMVETIERAAIPPLATIDAINNNTNIADRVVSYLWRNIVDKPTTFPPATHGHVKADISDFPATVAADWTTLANKPTTFPPSEHQHTKADITDFPATLPTTMSARIATVTYTGNGASTQTVTFNGDFVPLWVLVTATGSSSFMVRDGVCLTNPGVNTFTINSTFNSEGAIYGCLIMG